MLHINWQNSPKPNRSHILNPACNKDAKYKAAFVWRISKRRIFALVVIFYLFQIFILLCVMVLTVHMIAISL